MQGALNFDEQGSFQHNMECICCQCLEEAVLPVDQLMNHISCKAFATRNTEIGKEIF